MARNREKEPSDVSPARAGEEGKGEARSGVRQRESRSYARESGRQRRRRRRSPAGDLRLDQDDLEEIGDDSESRSLSGRPAAISDEAMAGEDVAIDGATLEELQDIASGMDIEGYEDMTEEELIDGIRQRR